MTLSCEVIDLIGLDLLDDTDERAGVGHISIVEVQSSTMLHVAYPFFEIDMLNATSVEGGGAANDPMDFVALLDEKFGEEGAILPRYPSDECNLIHVYMLCYMLILLYV